jgi:hypothetical protein
MNCTFHVGTLILLSGRRRAPFATVSLYDKTNSAHIRRFCTRATAR